MMVLYLAILLVALAECFTPNCITENQFKFYHFPIKGCSEFFSDRCKFHPSGYFKSLGHPSLVKIGETEILPTCAFYDAPSLNCIYGVNSKIKVLASWAFTNLPNLRSIHLAFNSISEIRKDVFKNVSVEILDLSWNNIVFIDQHAFAGINGLRYLNLSTNSLVTVPINYFPATLTHLIVRNNLLTRIALNSNKYLNLSVVDLSNNLIDKVAVHSAYPIELIDISNNRLTDFDYMDISYVNLIKIGNNRFENVPKYIESLNAKQMVIQPNPWKCDQLLLLWETLVSFSIGLNEIDGKKNMGSQVECYSMTSGKIITTRSTPCSGDHECVDYMTCKNKKCWDPCENTFCHESSQCVSEKHAFTCICPNNLLSDPLDIYGECEQVDCFRNADCPDGSCFNKKCIRNYPTTTSGGGFAYSPAPNSPGQASSRPSMSFVPLAEFEQTLVLEQPWWFDAIPSTQPANIFHPNMTRTV